MDESRTRRSSLSLEEHLVGELRACLQNIAVGAQFKDEPTGNLRASLEFYIPHVLSQKYPEWEQVELDGFHLGSALRSGAHTTEFYGRAYILDAGEAPFFIRLELTASQDSIACYQVGLGMPGKDKLDICIPAGRGHLVDTLNAPVDNILWKYQVDSADV